MVLAATPACMLGADTLCSLPLALSQRFGYRARSDLELWLFGAGFNPRSNLKFGESPHRSLGPVSHKPN